MAGTNFLPPREADLVTWANNFNTKVAASPTTYGLTAAQATAFTALHTAWNSAYQTANNPSTRTPTAITVKNQAKVNMTDGVGGIRQLARIVQAAPAVTPAQKQELGLTVRDTEPSPIPPPTIAPEIDFLPTGTRTIRIRLHNETTLSARKPDGVKGANVFYYVGATAPLSISEWTFYSGTSRTALDINLPEEVASGTLVWITAQWFNPRIESGPATTPVSTIVQHGGLAQAA